MFKQNQVTGFRTVIIACQEIADDIQVVRVGELILFFQALHSLSL